MINVNRGCLARSAVTIHYQVSDEAGWRELRLNSSEAVNSSLGCIRVRDGGGKSGVVGEYLHVFTLAEVEATVGGLFAPDMSAK